MLGSGSSVSLVIQTILQYPPIRNIQRLRHVPEIQLVTASGHPLLLNLYIRASVTLGKHQYTHNFIVVDYLVAHIIWGIDFFHKNELVLDVTTNPVTVSRSPLTNPLTTNTHSPHGHCHKICTILTGENNTTDVPNHCTIPSFSLNYCIELRTYSNKNIVRWSIEIKIYFETSQVWHRKHSWVGIITGSSDVDLNCLLRFYPGVFLYIIMKMLQLSITEESCSPQLSTFQKRPMV